MIDALRVKFTYDPETGVLQRRRDGRSQWHLSPKGYLVVTVGKGKSMYAHRIAWMIHHGEVPIQIDHINRNRADNRIENLRNSDQYGNAQNHGVRITSSSGHKGVIFNKRNKKWSAEFQRYSKQIEARGYGTIEEAIAARARMIEIFERGDWLTDFPLEPRWKVRPGR